jgi:DNA-binding MarR family transcriptional regulator
MFLHNYLPYRLNLLAELTSENTRNIYRSKHGLTRVEWRVLVNLAEVPSLTASDLCTRVPAHKTKVSRALAELEKRGWIKRTTDPQDRRIAHAMLTLKGKRALGKIQPEMEAATNALLAPLSPEDRATLDQGLAVLERLFATTPHRSTP